MQSVRISLFCGFLIFGLIAPSLSQAHTQEPPSVVGRREVAWILRKFKRVTPVKTSRNLLRLQLGRTVRHSALRVDQESIAGTGIAKGVSGIPLLRFRALAGRQDAKIAALTFRATSGNLDLASNYRLLVDRGGTGRFEDVRITGRTDGDLLTFSPVNLLVEDGAWVWLEVRADLRKTDTGTVGISFATDLPQYIEAVGVVDGRELTGIKTDGGECSLAVSTCWIAVSTRDVGSVTVGERGNLFVEAQDGVRSRQILLGTVTGPLLAFTMRADGEDIEVSNIVIEGGGQSIAFLEIRNRGGAVIGRARSSDCASPSTGRFCAALARGSLVIARGSEAAFSLHGVARADTEGGESGEQVALSLSAATSGVVAITARGMSSNQTLSQNDGDTQPEGEAFIGRGNAGANSAIAAPVHDTVAAKIEGISNANADPSGTAVPAGTYPIGKFRVRGAANRNSANGLNAVAFQTIVFSVSAVNVEMDASAFFLYNALSPSTKVSCTATSVTGAITVECASLQSGGIGASVPQGQSVDLVLQGRVVRPQISTGGSSLEVRLHPLGIRSEGGAIEWSDGNTSFDWVDLEDTSVESTLYRR